MSQDLMLPGHRVASILLRELAELRNGTQKDTMLHAAASVELLANERDTFEGRLTTQQRTIESYQRDNEELETQIETLKSQLKESRSRKRKKPAK